MKKTQWKIIGARLCFSLMALFFLSLTDTSAAGAASGAFINETVTLAQFDDGSRDGKRDDRDNKDRRRPGDDDRDGKDRPKPDGKKDRKPGDDRDGKDRPKPDGKKDRKPGDDRDGKGEKRRTSNDKRGDDWRDSDERR